MPAEKVRLRIGNLAKAVLVTGQAYQDPKDALNEFVSNAADDYAEAEQRGARIRIVLRRRARYPMIAVDDNGRGMSPDRLREVARNLFESSKAGDTRTLGEKAIGILAFQQLGGRCDIVSRPQDSAESFCLRLTRGHATAQLERERKRARSEPGTTVYLSQLEPDVLRVLTQRKVVDYLRARRGPALARGDYSIEVIEGRSSEVVTPERPEGVKLAIPARNTLWGRIEFSLYVAPKVSGRRLRVAVVGRAGTTIIDDLAELEEFDGHPWSSDQVSGQVVFEALRQSSGRRAVLRDGEAFPLFYDAVRSIEPAVVQTLERVEREVDIETADRLAEAVRRIFSRVLKELADIDNPMRSDLGSEEGEGATLAPEADTNGRSPATREGPAPEAPELGALPPDPPAPAPEEPEPQSAGPDRRRSRELPSLAPDPEPGDARSRFDAGAGVVLYNDRHADYLLFKDDDASLLDYLATLVAKEYVVYNNPRAATEDLGEEMVRMLVRVRRHLPRRR